MKFLSNCHDCGKEHVTDTITKTTIEQNEHPFKDYNYDWDDEMTLREANQFDGIEYKCKICGKINKLEMYEIKSYKVGVE